MEKSFYRSFIFLSYILGIICILGHTMNSNINTELSRNVYNPGNYRLVGPKPIPKPHVHLCYDITIRNTVDSFNLLTNCTVIEGNLEIVHFDFTKPSDFAKLSYPDLLEITGYLLVYRVNGLTSLGHLFPNLAVIRGTKLAFNYALAVYEMFQLEELGLSSLTAIVRGAVRIEKNPLLCYLDTVAWEQVFINPDYLSESIFADNGDPTSCSNRCNHLPDGSSPIYDVKRNELNGNITGDGNYYYHQVPLGESQPLKNRRWKTKLPPHCPINTKQYRRAGRWNNNKEPFNYQKVTHLCWGENSCQIICDHCPSKVCDKYGNCCHNECLGGCTGPSSRDCLSCKHFYYKRECFPKCPLYTYEYNDRRCISAQFCREAKKVVVLPSGESGSDLTTSTSDQIPVNSNSEQSSRDSNEPKFKIFGDKCLQNCPPSYMDDERDPHSCVKCIGPCPKVCVPVPILNIADSQQFVDCTVIDGNLEISIHGGESIVKELERNLGLIQTIKGYVKISRSFPLISLDFLSNLTHIYGQELWNKEYSFIILDNPNLEFLWDFNEHKNLTIVRGKLFFHFNPRLCLSTIQKLVDFVGLSGKTDNTEISKTSNGDKLACDVQQLTLSVPVVTSRLALIKWDAFKPQDYRSLLGYILSYRSLPNIASSNSNSTLSNQTMQHPLVNIYQGRDACSSDDPWKIIDVPATANSALGHPDAELSKVDNKILTVKIFAPTLDEMTTNNTASNNSGVDVAQSFLSQFLSSTLLGGTPISSPGSTYVEEVLPNLKPYTWYAAYVRTFTIASENYGARSDIVYFRTLPDEPSPPLSLRGLPLKATANSLNVAWDVPIHPNGEIYYYMLSWKKVVTNKDIKHAKDYCLNPLPILTMTHSPFLVAFTEDGSTTISHKEETSNDTSQQCCQCNGTSPLLLNKLKLKGSSSTAQSPALDEKDLRSKMDFENFLHQRTYIRRGNYNAEEEEEEAHSLAEFIYNSIRAKMKAGGNNLTMMVPSIFSQKHLHKRSLIHTASNVTEPSLSLLNNSFEFTNLTFYRSRQNSTLSTIRPDSSSKNGSIKIVATTREEFVTRTSLVRGWRNTTFNITGLQHFQHYQISVKACQQNRTNRAGSRWCSKEAITVIRTLPLEGADDINQTRIQYTVFERNQTIYITWQPPPNPNGMIVSYDIAFNGIDHPNRRYKDCVSLKMFKLLGGWRRVLDSGNYSFTIQATSFYGKSRQTEPFYFFVPLDPKTAANLYKATRVVRERAAIAGFIAFAVIVTLFTATTLFWCLVIRKRWQYYLFYDAKRRRFVYGARKRKLAGVGDGSPLPPIGGWIYSSVNPDYVTSSEVYIPDEYEIERDHVILDTCSVPLGQGSFGIVYRGEMEAVSEGGSLKYVDCAVKTIHETASSAEKIQFLKEASVMKGFDCYHIVKLLGVVSKSQPTLVLMELMEGGDLKTFLRAHRPCSENKNSLAHNTTTSHATSTVSQHKDTSCLITPPPQAPNGVCTSMKDKLLKQPLTFNQYLQMAGEIGDGMAYLSALHIVHRDLAARNCMVAADMTVKVGDFGMTRDIYETDYYRKGGKGLMPVRWMSPESLKDGIFTSLSDVWSYGIVLWEIATLAWQPYQGLSNEQVVNYVINGGILEKPRGCPDQLYELMKLCWGFNPKSRPSFWDIVEILYPDLNEKFKQVSYYSSILKDLSEERSEASSTVESLEGQEIKAPSSTAVSSCLMDELNHNNTGAVNSVDSSHIITDQQPKGKISNATSGDYTTLKNNDILKSVFNAHDFRGENEENSKNPETTSLMRDTVEDEVKTINACSGLASPSRYNQDEERLKGKRSKLKLLFSLPRSSINVRESFSSLRGLLHSSPTVSSGEQYAAIKYGDAANSKEQGAVPISINRLDERGDDDTLNYLQPSQLYQLKPTAGGKDLAVRFSPPESTSHKCKPVPDGSHVDKKSKSVSSSFYAYPPSFWWKSRGKQKQLSNPKASTDSIPKS